ncbi:MAG: signal peptidase II [Thermoleophilia bacterium]|nr:signal peptidase II [Thermoleophilia bacterium]
MGPGTTTTRLLVGAGIAAAGTLVLDQVTKAAARRAFEPGEVRDVALGGQVAVGHVQNHGSAYGLIGKMPWWVPAIGTATIGGGMLAIGRTSRVPLAAGIGAGLLIGGGVSNVVDRVRQGHVTDLLHTTDAFGYYNVADVAISAGMATGAAVLLLAR